MTDTNNNLQWWLGLADVLGHGVQHGAAQLKRVHLSVADEAFQVLDTIPVTRPASRIVRAFHHGISTLSYDSVSLAGRAAVGLAGVTSSTGVASRTDDESMNKS
ncbi:hypothetical protein [Marinobacter litoralis]|uniref:hypothetical protein n=1 Tax=Marinobacter litoralis TaxID=187981 RepID=UPI0018EB8AEE|nr:hypothetical protein [Marinobacter litoralis]MBJ6136533.1 hypothetical protein [Marinobacter litoralis]